jgi:uncharacterized protein YcaQ
MPLTLERLRRHALARSLFAPTTLKRAVHKLGFLQADPIRAPARAQDLTLRHRVRDYRAGDLERRYQTLGIAEDFFVNYGFLPLAHQALMHPRAGTSPWSAAQRRRAEAVLEFVRERGVVHPREVDTAFGSRRATNWFGGTSAASTQLLDAMHYRGLLRVARREGGTRCYAAHEHAVEALDAAARQARIDALVDIVVHTYAPLPATSLSGLISRLRGGAPQWRGELRAAVARTKQRLASAHVGGVDWYWPADEEPPRRLAPANDTLRLLAPFDPVVWDRRRFELFWGWAYRFEAYTPAPKRQLGYYALPLLWRDEVIGWGNLALTRTGALDARFGYVAGRAPRDAAFRRELDAELARLETFVSPSS